MAGLDTWRTIGWGPFALPGERAAAEQASEKTRAMLRDAGLLIEDAPAVPGAPEAPPTTVEGGITPARSAPTPTPPESQSLVAVSEPSSSGELAPLNLGDDDVARAIRAAVEAAGSTRSAERYKTWSRRIHKVGESPQWSVVKSEGDDARIVGGAETRRDAAEFARNFLRGETRSSDPGRRERRMFIVVYSAKVSFDQGIDLLAPSMRLFFDLRHRSETDQWTLDRGNSLESYFVSFDGEDLDYFLKKGKGSGKS